MSTALITRKTKLGFGFNTCIVSMQESIEKHNGGYWIDGSTSGG